MSEELKQDRVEVLAKMVEEIDDDYSKLHKELNDELVYFQDELKNKIDSELFEIRKEVNESLADLRKQFGDKVRERIEKASSDEIAEALTSRLAKVVIATRPATREEIKSGQHN